MNMDADMSIEVLIVVGQKIRGRHKRKHVRYFTLKHMTAGQYTSAVDMLATALTDLGQSYLDLGYSMQYQGKDIASDNS